MYKISEYTKAKAKKIGVNVRPSKTAGKKIDVYKNGTKLASIGAIGYNDYPTYLELERKRKVPKGTANERRKMYKLRHSKDRKRLYSNGWYADQLLW
jgi:hypothetical protein